MLRDDRTPSRALYIGTATSIAIFDCGISGNSCESCVSLPSLSPRGLGWYNHCATSALSQSVRYVRRDLNKQTASKHIYSRTTQTDSN